MSKEAWKPVPGFEGLYEVSDHGRVRSLARVSDSINRWGPIKRRFPGRILVTSPHTADYPQVTLCDGKGGRHQRLVHWLVAAAFLGPRPDGLDILHRDGVKTNCREANLRYGTPRENSADAVKHGHQVRGERQGGARFTEADIRQMRALRGKMFQKDIAKMFGTSRVYVGLIQRRRWWQHVQ